MQGRRLGTSSNDDEAGIKSLTCNFNGTGIDKSCPAVEALDGSLMKRLLLLLRYWISEGTLELDEFWPVDL